MNSLPCDVFLGAHGGYYNMEEKFTRLQAASSTPQTSAANPFIDPAGYKAYVADRNRAFLDELHRQQQRGAVGLHCKSASP